MLLKYTLKNIFSKPGRLIILMLCIIVASFTAFLAVDVGTIADHFLTEVFNMGYGTSDYMVMCISGEENITEETFQGSPVPLRYATAGTITRREIRRDEKLYTYALTDKVTVYAFPDPDTAAQMNLFKDYEMPADGEIAIGKRYSEKYGYQPGDTILFRDPDENEIPLTVASIFRENGMVGGDDSSLVATVNYDQYVRIHGETPFRKAYVDLLGDEKEDYEAFEAYMEENHRSMLPGSVRMPESMQEMLDNVIAMIYLIFVMVFILVIFVTASFTEKIINERMSVIGTLRSIGMSTGKTSFILLFENVLYGFSGSTIAMLLYLLCRKAVEMIMQSDPEEAGFTLGPVNVVAFLMIILAAILIETLIPLKEVLKAVGTSIRDIIFDNRDSEAKVSLPLTVLGAVLIGAGLVMGLCIDHLALEILALLLLVAGAGLVIPFIVRKITWRMSSVFGKAGMPVAELAAVECGSKKANIGNAILAVTTICASSAIFVAGFSFADAVTTPIYDADIIVSGTFEETKEYRFLEDVEGVTEVEYLYSYDDAVACKGIEKQCSVRSLPQSGMVTMFRDVPKDLQKYEVALDLGLATKLKLKEGDTVLFTFHSGGLFPIQKELTVRTTFCVSSLGEASLLLLNPELYKEIFPDEVKEIVIRTADTESVAAALRDSFPYGEELQTREELESENEDTNLAFHAGLIVLIGAAFGLTLIGITGNQAMGFSARKKEYAILHSCACTQSRLIRLIWLENAMLFGVSVLTAAILSVPVVIILERIFILAAIGVYIEIRFGTLAGCVLILWLITMLTAFTPIRSLKKMNTAMELKYE